MNQGSILTPVAKGYNSKDLFASADVISEKVRARASSAGVLAKHYSADAAAYVKRNPVNVALIATSAVILFTAYIYRSEIASLYRRWT